MRIIMSKGSQPVLLLFALSGLAKRIPAHDSFGGLYFGISDSFLWELHFNALKGQHQQAQGGMK